MAKLYTKMPNGATKSIDLDATSFNWTANSSINENGWYKLPNGLLIEWCRRNNVENVVNSVAGSNSNNVFDSYWYISPVPLHINWALCCISALVDANQVVAESILSYITADGNGVYWKLTGYNDTGSTSIETMYHLLLGVP